MRRNRRGYNGRRAKPRQRKQPVVEQAVVIPTPPAPVPTLAQRKHQEMLDLIARTKARLERQAQRDWDLQQLYENEPVVADSIVWHPHTRGVGR